MIVAGIGCRKGETPENIIEALLTATHTYGMSITTLSALASGSIKSGEEALRRAAESLGIPLFILSDEQLHATTSRIISHSDQSIKYTGLPSLCEASALAAAGEASQLTGPRLIHCGVTVALASSSGGATSADIHGGTTRRPRPPSGDNS